jgi:transposase, IS6 family
VLAVRWYLRYSLSCRDLDELLAERNIMVDHATLRGGYNASHHCSSNQPGRAGGRLGNRWFVDETYPKISGVWRYVYRAIDQHGQIIDRGVVTDRVSQLASAHTPYRVRSRQTQSAHTTHERTQIRGLKTIPNARVVVRATPSYKISGPDTTN